MTAPMSDATLDDIRALTQLAEEGHCMNVEGRALVAEVDRLREELAEEQAFAQRQLKALAALVNERALGEHERDDS